MTARDIDARVLTAQRALLDTWRADMRRGAGRVGWKLRYDIPEVESLVGAQPVVGYVTAETLLEDGGTYTGPRIARTDWFSTGS
ncbi:MAG TPA: hypothetical protein VFE00_03995 [Arthrobacter sp.]|nr:hypothetical protein [Arthrobacter sp.]